jgi:hypothetical protein
VGELRRGQRAARADVLEHRGDEVGPLGGDAPHAAPRLVVRPAHPPAQVRLQRHVDERRLVAPVLEQPPRRAVREPVEQLAVVRAEAAEDRQVVRPLQDVDAVDLDEREPREDPRPDRPHVDVAVERRVGEALRRQCDATRLGGREPFATSRHGAGW